MVCSVEMFGLLGEIRKVRRLNRLLSFALVLLSVSITLAGVFLTGRLQESDPHSSLKHFGPSSVTFIEKGPAPASTVEQTDTDIGSIHEVAIGESVGSDAEGEGGDVEYDPAEEIVPPVEYGREELWGCYDYHEGALGTARVKASEERLERLNCTKKPPGAWIIGVKKCGSQTLTGLLDLHPSIVSSIYLDRTDEMLLGKDEFTERYMPLTTPTEMALFDMVGLQNRHDVLRHVVANISSPETRYILILTDPIRRAISDYVHCRIKLTSPKNVDLYPKKRRTVWNVRQDKPQEGKVSFFREYKIASTFEKSVLNQSGGLDLENGLIHKGIYLNYVKEILEIIPRERLLVISGAEFISRPWAVLSRAETFLNVPSFFVRGHFRKEPGGFYCPVLKERPDAGCIAGKGRKKPSVHHKVKKMLSNFYRPYKRKLQLLLGDSFSLR